MSTARYGFNTVPTNTTNPSVPVNDFMRLVDALLDTVVEDMTLTAPPSTTESDVGLVWIPAATASGDWTGHENELALCVGEDQWLFIAPPEGKRVRLAATSGGGGTDYVFDGSAWQEVASGDSEDIDIVTEGSAFTASVATHSGRGTLVLAGGDVTFDSAQSYSAGKSFNIRATAALELVEAGVTLTPPAGGSLELDADMAVTVVFTGSAAAVVIGQSVASS